MGLGNGVEDKEDESDGGYGDGGAGSMQSRGAIWGSRRWLLLFDRSMKVRFILKRIKLGGLWGWF